MTTMADLSKLDLAQLSAAANAQITVESRGEGVAGTVEFDHGHERQPIFSGPAPEGRVAPTDTSAAVLEDAMWVSVKSQGETAGLDAESFLEIAPRMVHAIKARRSISGPNFGALPFNGYLNASRLDHKPGCSVTRVQNGAAYCTTCRLLFVGKG